VLDDLVCLSLPVARIWGFNDLEGPSSIRRTRRRVPRGGLRGLDQAVWEAKRRGIRVDPAAGQQLGRVRRLPGLRGVGLGTFGGTYDARRLLHERADEAVVEGLRVHARDARQHVHGRGLPDEPAILAWEIGNELRCRAARGTTRCPTPSPSWRRS
jgi:hypothetical protein